MGTERGRAIHLAALAAAGRTETADRLRASWKSGGRLAEDEKWIQCRQICFGCKECDFPKLPCGKKKAKYLAGFVCPLGKWPIAGGLVLNGRDVHGGESSSDKPSPKIIPGSDVNQALAGVNLVNVATHDNAVSADDFVEDDGASLVDGGGGHNQEGADRQDEVKSPESHGHGPFARNCSRELR